MNLVRGLERRLEAVLDGLAGRLFRGSLHPTELATRILRHADLSLSASEFGPVAANSFILKTRPLPVDDLTLARISAELCIVVEREALERGWRLEGPVEIAFEMNPALAEGDVQVESCLAPGQRRPWATLAGDSFHPIAVNFCVVGRSPQADVIVIDQSVSRRHALLWTVAGHSFISDLGSSNGTTLDGVPVTAEPVRLHHLSVIRMGEVTYRLEMV